MVASCSLIWITTTYLTNMALKIFLLFPLLLCVLIKSDGRIPSQCCILHNGLHFFWCATVQLFSSQAVLLGLGVPLEFMCRKLRPLSCVNDGRWGLWEANESWEPSLSEWNNPFMDWESPETMTAWISYPEKGVVRKARLASFHQCLTAWNTAWDFIESLSVTASCLAQVLDLGLARSQNCRKPKSILDTWSHLRYFYYTNRK